MADSADSKSPTDHELPPSVEVDQPPKDAARNATDDSPGFWGEGLKGTLQQQKEQYKAFMSEVEYSYFEIFSVEARNTIIERAAEYLQAQNIEQIKAKTFGLKFMEIGSHELRTPLNGLIGVIDLMQGDDMSPNQRLYIKTLEQSCNHLLSVVNRMQDLAALQSGNPTNNIMPFDMRAVMTGVAESMQHLSIHHGPGTQVNLHIDPDLPLSVNGDLTKIQQILANLVGVAVISSKAEYEAMTAKFEPLDGSAARIHIEISGKKTQTPKTQLRGFDLKFSFDDLFRPLTANTVSHGIVICREFLKPLGSVLEVDVDEEDTLIFKFSLNVTYNNLAVGRNPEILLQEARAAVRIMVAEDNHVSRRIVLMMLSKLGFSDVVGLENGQEAIATLQTKPFDIILMDCDMPVMDGYKATQHIRTKLNNTSIRIVALTANSTNDARSRCILVGMDDYFTKPITMKTLSEMLHKWLRMSGPLPFLAGA